MLTIGGKLNKPLSLEKRFHCLAALKRNNEKSLLLSYEGLSSTISSSTRSTSDLKRLVNEGQLHRNFGAETHILSYAKGTIRTSSVLLSGE